MKATTLDENIFHDIGHSFGYYDYKEEHGLVDACPSNDAAAEYICGYAKMALQSGMLHTTSKDQEAFIAYKKPGERVGFKAGLILIKAMPNTMKLKGLFHFDKTLSKSGQSLSKRFDKEKKPYIFVGLVCVREQYQGQGFMRKAMAIAFAEGERLRIPVILETDAKSKCDKYMHLGMELAGTRKFTTSGKQGTLYDLVKYPNSQKKTEDEPLKRFYCNLPSTACFSQVS